MQTRIVNSLSSEAANIHVHDHLDFKNFRYSGSDHSARSAAKLELISPRQAEGAHFSVDHQSPGLAAKANLAQSQNQRSFTRNLILTGEIALFACGVTLFLGTATGLAGGALLSAVGAIHYFFDGQSAYGAACLGIMATCGGGLSLICHWMADGFVQARERRSQQEAATHHS